MIRAHVRKPGFISIMMVRENFRDLVLTKQARPHRYTTPRKLIMLNVTPDGSVLDRDGRVIFFSLERFISDIVEGDCCFICGAERSAVSFNDEHVIPDWILRRFELHRRQIQIPNESLLRYGSLTVPCCVDCNTQMGELFEEPMSALFASGFEAVSRELKNHGPWTLFSWMALILLKTHLKDTYLRYHLDQRKGDLKIGELHSWKDLHHLHCVARSFHSGAGMKREVLGSLVVLPAKVRPHFDGFDFVDLSAAQTMLLTIGEVAVIVVFNDSQYSLSVVAEVDLPKIGGSLSPVQLRELASKFASINLLTEPRTRFASEFERSSGEYVITADRPNQVQLRAWDNELFGRIMYSLTKDFLESIPNKEEIGSLVKSGRYTFLTTPSGTFDFDSMEIEQKSESDTARQ